MVIFLENYNCGAKQILKKSGYKPREKEKDWVREDEQGRFHAKIDRRDIYIHYDLTVDYRHVSFNLPDKHNQERKRIMRKLYPFQKAKPNLNKLFSFVKRVKI